MKKYFFYIAVALVSMASVFYACSEDEKNGDPDQFSIGADALSFAAAGESKTFTVTANIAWSAAVPSDASWLTVSPASGSGNQTITVTAAPNTATTARNADVTVSANGFGSKKVTVTQAGAPATPAFVAVTGITGVPTAATAGTPLTLTGTVAPTNATNKTIVWSVKSAGATGATISGATLNTTAAGTVTVTATIANGATATTPFTRDFTITVNTGFVAVTGITGVPSAATAGTPLTLTGTVAPTNATNKTIVWSVKSAGATGATISGSTLNTTAAGTVTVTATIANGATATTPFTRDFTITVSTGFVAVTGITGVPTTATAGTPLTLTGTVAPTNATNKTIVWSVKSAGATGATISGSTLNTTAAGTVTVTATIANGATATTPFTRDFTITVSAGFVAVSNITGVPTAATAGTPLTLTGTVAPTNATNKTIVWSVKSAGTTGATISGSTLNTTAAGTVTVTATIANGATATTPYTKDFTITVSAAAPTPTIAVTGTGLNNFQVGKAVSGASIIFTLSNGQYIASPYVADFGVSGLPAGVVEASTVRTSNTVITVILGGTPKTANTSSVTLTPKPSPIPARNVTGATAPIPVSGTITAGPVAAAAPTPTIAVTANGLTGLQVGTAVSGNIVYTLTNGQYAASITAANFAVSGLPAGLTAGTATRINSTMVTININGTPTTANASTVTVTRPATIPQANVTGATAAVAVSGTITVGAIAAPTYTITISAQGLSNLKVGTPVNNALIYYFLNDGQYATSITPAHFAVSGLPAGLTASTAVRSMNNLVVIGVSGTPTTANSSTVTITRPSTIPQANVTGATAAVAVSGTITAGPIAATPYTVTLNKYGGSGGTNSVTATYGQAMPSATMPTRTGYAFAGYYDTNASTGGTQYYTAAGASARNYDKFANTTLYARWTAPTPTIAVTASGLSNLQVGKEVNGYIVYQVSNGEYSNITESHFNVSGLPPGLKVTHTSYNFAQVTLWVGGAPTASNSRTVTLTRPNTIPASNVVGATAPVAVSGTITAGPIE